MAQQYSPKELLEIFQRSALADPSNYQLDQESLSPIEDMLGRSQLLDLGRQYLPEKAGDTKAVQWINQQLPSSENPDSFVEKFKRGLSAVPMGGISERELNERKQLRAVDPVAKRYTTLRGEVPLADGATAPTGDSLRAATAQNLGVAAADVATDGLRNIWWFLNAPQAVASLATLQALHGGGKEFVDPASGGQFLRNRGLRLAATVPAMIGMSMAVGNFGRQAGYTAAVPSEADKTQTADPLAEAASRYILGRTGSLLPYDEFVKERPDVSKGEYEAYKAYLHGNSLPLKATLDGINGPEVTFLGKSIPVLTGVLPAVAAVAGTAFGVRKAGRRLMEEKALQTEAALLDNALEMSLAGREVDTSGYSISAKENMLRRNLRELNAGAALRKNQSGQPLPAVAAANEYYSQRDANQAKILEQALVYSSGGLAGAALAGQTLELLRRSLKGDVAAEPEPVAPAPAVEVK